VNIRQGTRHLKYLQAKVQAVILFFLEMLTSSYMQTAITDRFHSTRYFERPEHTRLGNTGKNLVSS